ncbi:MAG: SLC13 family permease [Gemmatimonadales bacterium]
MTPDIALTLAITLGALGLFIWNRLRMDLVGLIIMTMLIVTGLLTPAEGISGFANEAMVTVAAMFVLSAGMIRTGGVDRMGRWVARLAGESEVRLIMVCLAIVIPLSAFVNNTPVVVVMIPIVLGICRTTGIVPSRVFMPISFASQMGGTTTLIGTSTNLLVAGLALDLGLPRLGLFAPTLPALVLAAVGVLYLLTVGRWLTPHRQPAADLQETYALREYVTVLTVESASSVVGKTLGEAQFASTYGLEVIGVERDGTRHYAVDATTRIEALDVLLVRGRVTDISRIEQEVHLRLATPEAAFPVAATDAPEDAPQLAELMVPPRSRMIGQSVRQLNFRHRYGIPVLGIQRHGTALRERMRDIPLQAGDLLLVRGASHELQRVHEGHELMLLGTVEIPARRRRKLPLAVAITTSVVVLAALSVLPIMVSALLGVVAMVLTGCLTIEEAYDDVDWMVLVLLGAIIPLGLAMLETGTATFLAHALLNATSSLGLHGMLAAFFLLTTLLTSVISNNAAAVVLTPVAIATASGLAVSPLPFVITVMLGASTSYITPVGYQTNLFIFGPGGYRFADFLRVGGPLTVLTIVVATMVIPLFFPFHP